VTQEAPNYEILAGTGCGATVTDVRTRVILTKPSGAGIVVVPAQPLRLSTGAVPMLPGLEIAPAGWFGGEEDPLMFWKEALKAAKSYRGGGCNGWRLPTTSDLGDIHPKREEIPGLLLCEYWSSDSEDALYADTWDFKRGKILAGFKRDHGGRRSDGSPSALDVRVRPVRDFILPPT
jgi:hypothetical protein